MAALLASISFCRCNLFSSRCFFFSSSVSIDFVDKELSDLIDVLIELAFTSFDHFKVVSLMKKIVPEYISNHSEFQILDDNDKNIL